VHKIKEALGRIEQRQLTNIQANNIQHYEIRVFSQWGEDGIIQFLINNIAIENRVFVEFGVQNYTESNTRFLLINNNWSGLVIDGSKKNIEYIKRDPIYWQYNLNAVNKFITKENINQIILDNGIKAEIGILSVDIDGNDYWVWDAIDCISPAIVIVEYNSRFGPKEAVTVPYDENFTRSSVHHSMIYYGASLNAFCKLAAKKGYTFIGCNSAGNNAFFVLSGLKPENIQELTPEEGFIAAQFRESRDSSGKLAYLSREEELKVLSELPLIKIN